jgi:hypothetical protein
MEQARKPKERKIDYGKFGIDYVAGRKVCHLHVGGRIKTQCGLYRLGLKVTPDCGPPVCRNCMRTVKIMKGLGKRIAVYRLIDEVVSIVERSGGIEAVGLKGEDQWQS